MALRRSKPKSLTDRLRTGTDVAANAARSAGSVGAELARTTRDRAVAVRRDPRGSLTSGRKRAFAMAGAAAGAAGAFAFWRARQDDRPPTHTDPARPGPADATAAHSAGVATPAGGGEETPAAAEAAGSATKAAGKSATAAAGGGKGAGKEAAGGG